MITAQKIDAKASVVGAIAQATAMVQNASPEELDAVIVEAKKMVEAAEEEQDGIVSRWYVKAKRMVTAPVDYVFGEENSKAKTAFYAVAGAALLAAGAYAVSNYRGGGVDVVEEASRPLIVRSEWTPKIQAFLKKEFGDDPEAQTAGLGGMIPALQDKKLKLIESSKELDREITAAEQEWADLEGQPFDSRRVRIYPAGSKSSDLDNKIMSLEAQKGRNFRDQRELDSFDIYYQEMKYNYPGKLQGVQKETLAQDDKKLKEISSQLERRSIANVLKDKGNEYLLELSTEEIQSMLGALENEVKQVSDQKDSIADQMKSVESSYFYLFSESRDSDLKNLQDKALANQKESKKLGFEHTLLKSALEARGVDLAAEGYEVVNRIDKMRDYIEQPSSEDMIRNQHEINRNRMQQETSKTISSDQEDRVESKEKLGEPEKNVDQEAVVAKPEAEVSAVELTEDSVKPEEITAPAEKSDAEKEESARWAKIRVDRLKKQSSAREKEKI